MADEPQAPLDAGVRPAQAVIQNQNRNVQLQQADGDEPQVQQAQNIAAAPAVQVYSRVLLLYVLLDSFSPCFPYFSLLWRVFSFPIPKNCARVFMQCYFAVQWSL